MIPIHLPPLRERPVDISLLAGHLLRRFAAEEGKGFRALNREVEAVFLDYGWPGNIRQLQALPQAPGLGVRLGMGPDPA